MARNEGMWQKVKKSISNEIRDDEKLAANLAGKDLCMIIRGMFTGDLPLMDVLHVFNVRMKDYIPAVFGVTPIHLEELRAAFEKFRRQLRERVYERRLLRAAALFAGSIFVMRNFGELMSV